MEVELVSKMCSIKKQDDGQSPKKKKIVLRKDVFVILFDVLCWHLSGENEESHNKTLSR